MKREPDPITDVPAHELEKIDAVCLQFERDWKAGNAPQLENFLNGFVGEVRATLVAELLLLDIDYRTQIGDSLNRAGYSERLPDDGNTIDSVFELYIDSKKSNDTVCDQQFPTQITTDQYEQIPERIGRYRVVRKLGAGGFATVYLAHDDELQRDVAIKFPRVERLKDFDGWNVYLEEARMLATLNHPAIVPVYDVGRLNDDSDVCYVVSQFMNAGDLREYIQSNSPTIEESVDIVIRLAEALNHAHSRGLVHRDVKPSNILRDSDGMVYIADFGLALREKSIGRRIGFAGTPASMSPEQILGDGHLVDGRTDIYSLGVVLYELLTGQQPFTCDDISTLLQQIEHRPPKPLSQLKPSIPKELEKICLKALAKRPDDRFSSASDMVGELGNFRGIQSSRDKLFTLPRMIIATAAATFLLIAGWWLSTSGIETNTGGSANGLNPPPVKTLAVLPFQTIGEQAKEHHLGLGMTDTLITKLSNVRRLVVRSVEAVQNRSELTSDPLAAGRELFADVVLDGSVQQIDNRISVTVRLVRVRDGERIWSATFDEPNDKLFGLQDEISSQLVNALSLQVTRDETKRINLRYTDSPEAYEAYVKGIHEWHQRAELRRGGLELAIKHFKAAIDADPLFAQAYVGLAKSYAMTNLYSQQDDQAFPRARAAAEKAIELDPGQTDAYAVLALITHYYDWDWDAAEKGFQRAIKLNPNNASAHQWYAELLYFSKRFDESIVHLGKALELDPLSPTIIDLQGVPYMWRRDYKRARLEFEKAERLNPDSVNLVYGLGTCAMMEGRFEEALEYHRRRNSGYQEAYVLTKMGRNDEARAILKQLIVNYPLRGSPFNIAIIFTGLGEFDDAFYWLDQARVARDERMVWLLVDPQLDPIRDDPRFRKLLQDIGRIN